jgi:hypothetical protein
MMDIRMLVINVSHEDQLCTVALHVTRYWAILENMWNSRETFKKRIAIFKKWECEGLGTRTNLILDRMELESLWKPYCSI